MPEFRTDRLTGRSVVIAENRAGRPNEFAPVAGQGNPPSQVPDEASPIQFACPFCPGHEAETPPAVYEQRGDDGRWRLRVVPNKYPALTLDSMPPLPMVEDSPWRGEGRGEGEETGRSAVGAHEVVIESPRHIESVTALPVAELGGVLEAYAQRLDHWHADGRFHYALVFKNVGRQAGASLSHVHSQLIALPDVPPVVQRELERATAEFKSRRVCPYCHLIDQERTSGERIVIDREDFVAFCPFASLLPYEVWLLPARHEPWFERGESIVRLADVLHDLLRRVEAVAPSCGYNLLLRTGPWDDAAAGWSHWRIEVLPRMASIAGLELATGVHINPVAPEHAARQMR